MQSYLSDKTRFADLFNSIVGQGKTLFTPDDMREINSSQGMVVQDKQNRKLRIQRHRDIVMETARKEKLFLLEIENQKLIHYAMPVRSMMYHALNYTNQVKHIAKENRAQKRVKGGEEFLSGLRKRDKLYPVITLVFYYGSKPRDAGEDIYSMPDVEAADLDLFKKYIPNYHMNLVKVNDLAENNSFKSDLQWMFGMLKYKEDKKELIRYMKEHKDFFGNIDENAFGVAKAILGGRSIPKVTVKTEEGKRGIDMCKALDDWYQDGVNEGISRGISEGIGQGEERFRRLCLRLFETGSKQELEKVLRDSEYRKVLYEKYKV